MYLCTMREAKKCKTCNIYKDSYSFGRAERNSDSLKTTCKECHNLLRLRQTNYTQKKKKELTEKVFLTEKVCSKCKILKDHSNYYRVESCVNSFFAMCKPCHIETYYTPVLNPIRDRNRTKEAILSNIHLYYSGDVDMKGLAILSKCSYAHTSELLNEIFKEYKKESSTIDNVEVHNIKPIESIWIKEFVRTEKEKYLIKLEPTTIGDWDAMSETEQKLYV